MTGFYVVLHDDDDHSLAYVEKVLRDEFCIDDKDDLKELLERFREFRRLRFFFQDAKHALESQERIFLRGPDPLLRRSVASLVVSVEEHERAGIRLVRRGRVGPRGFESFDPAHRLGWDPDEEPPPGAPFLAARAAAPSWRAPSPHTTKDLLLAASPRKS